MANPLDAFIGEAKDTVVLVVVVIMVIIVLGAMGVAFGMEEFTNQIINSMTWGLLLILAIPSAALIIFIIWIIKKAQEGSWLVNKHF
jgi:hypothetical protein